MLYPAANVAASGDRGVEGMSSPVGCEAFSISRSDAPGTGIRKCPPYVWSREPVVADDHIGQSRSGHYEL